MKNILIVILLFVAFSAFSQKTSEQYIGGPYKKYSIEEGLKTNLKKVQSLYVRIDSLEDLEYVHKHICKFKKLKDLDFYIIGFEPNNGYDFPDCLCELKQLLFIDFTHHTKVKREFPKAFLKIKSLISIRYTANLSAIPDDIGKLKNLESLEIDDADSLTMLSNLRQLKKLTFLSLCHNGLNSMPTGLEKVEFLLLNFNKFVEIPKAFSTYKSLVYLEMYHNQVTEISTDIQFIKKLESLQLWANKVEYIDVDALKNLSNLDYLGLRFNNISKEIYQELVEKLPDIRMDLKRLKKYNSDLKN